jgi:hypothetical protein
MLNKNIELKQTTEFKYLGSVIASNGKIQAEIENRCCKESQILGQLTPILQNKHVILDTKRALYNTIFFPMLCYHCQTWSLTATEKRKTVTTEMKCLRRILNVSRLDKIRNKIIRQRNSYTCTGLHQEAAIKMVRSCKQITTKLHHSKSLDIKIQW